MTLMSTNQRLGPETKPHCHISFLSVPIREIRGQILIRCNKMSAISLIPPSSPDHLFFAYFVCFVVQNLIGFDDR